MIIGAVMLVKGLLFGGELALNEIFPADFTDRIGIYVTDENKADELKNIYNTIIADYGKFENNMDKKIKKLSETRSNYQTTTSELAEQMNDIFKLKEETQSKFLDNREKMKDLVTEEQWNKLFDRSKENNIN